MAGDAQADVRLFRRAAAVVFRQLRTERGWSYREFGERVGIAHTSLHAVERADQTPSIETLSMLAQASSVSFLDLLSRIISEVHRLAAADAGAGTDVDANRAAMLRFDLLQAAQALQPEQQEELARYAAWLAWRDTPSAASNAAPPS